MDVWEANLNSAAVTPHACSTIGQTMCSGDACGGTYSATRYAGECDPDGCDFNSYRMGDTSFYGPGLTVDTTKVFTVVTQFIDDPLTEIKRYYVQNGKVIPNSQSQIAYVTSNSITTAFWDAQKTAFGDNNTFDQKGEMAQMGKAVAGILFITLFYKQFMYHTISRAFINIPGIIVLYCTVLPPSVSKINLPPTKTIMLIPSTPAYAFACSSFLKEVIALSNASIIPSYIILWPWNVPV